MAHIDRLREFRDWWAEGAKWSAGLLPRLAEAAGRTPDGDRP